MATPHAVQMLNAARSGQKLTPQDRRHVIAYLMTFGDVSKGTNGDEYLTPPMTNVQMADLFQVTDRTIKNDKAAIREQMAHEIKNEDIALILADVRHTFVKVMLNIEKSAAKSPLGSRRYLDHQMALAKLQTDYVKGMQDLGVYPKELGTLHVDKFEFSAQVGLEATGRPLNLFDKKREAPVLDAVPVKELSDGKETEYQSGRESGSAEESVLDPVPNPDQAGDAEPPASSLVPAIQAD